MSWGEAWEKLLSHSPCTGSLLRWQKCHLLPGVGTPWVVGKGACQEAWIPPTTEHLTLSIYRAEEAGGSREKGSPGSPH